ncbi:thymidine kinase [Microvenator marinus]|uniref:Thymidine kinase n=1 Tax=Microvenator marinus TaxID=2600177 RepID=A0A5B8XLN3_9DELT|nr:thymidine kinase [Microvenator marinus]QED25997.1 thymidine kinase [Microvenator marinus]
MFIPPKDIGWVEVICGPMFSGKTEELIRRIRRASFAKQRVQVFKPKIDDRYDANAIVSHNQERVEGIPVSDLKEMRQKLDPHVEVVGIDEIQFFDQGVVDFCDELANKGCRVIVAGLDLDYLGEPFGPLPRLICQAEYVSKLLAICVRCGNPAHHSYRLSTDPQQVLVGSTDQYEAICRRCFKVGQD